jgi:methylamine--corrinoid protein Co-methyltransferase
VLFQRECEDDKKPFICAGMAGTPMNEEEFLLSLISIVKEEWVDGIDHGMLSEIKGTQVKTGSPLEIRSCRAEVELLFRGLLSAGRPGLHVLDAESSVTGIGGVSILNNHYLRKTDAQLLFMENELKTNYNVLAQVAANIDYGCHNVGLVVPVMGGWCRGPAGTAITAVASVLLTAIPYLASYFLWHPVGTRVIGSTRPEFLWTESVVGQAIAKHTKFILLGNVWPNFGAGTQTIFDEIAANTIVNTISALNLLGPSATAAIRPHGTGLEARFMGEVSRIIREQALDRKTGNIIALKYIKRFADKLSNPDLGKPFMELYDRKTLTPVESWAEMYYKALDEAKTLIKKS